MNIRIEQSWENLLLAWAYEALHDTTPSHAVRVDGSALRMAYQHCEAITRYHSRTFFVASGLLPIEKRRAVRALYAFCRTTDDIVDNAHDRDSAHEALENWRRIVQSPHQSPSVPVALAWADTQARYNIPRGYAEQLINGVARDLKQNRYPTFDALAEYSYGVASTVGLMAMHIIGFAGEEALPYAVKLGVALQLTNILRDVGEDWQSGRLYLPQDELQAFGLSEADIENGRVDERWQAFIRYQIERNRQLYREAWDGIQLLNVDGRFAIGAAAELYRAILSDIELHDGDVFRRRAYISRWEKLRRLPEIWWRTRSGVAA